MSELGLEPGNVPHTRAEALDFNGTLLFDLNPIQFRLSGLYSAEDEELNPAPVRNLLNQDPDKWSVSAPHLRQLVQYVKRQRVVLKFCDPVKFAAGEVAWAPYESVVDRKG